jgi:uncharacterized membrane protein YjjP (DUF1212 family)
MKLVKIADASLWIGKEMMESGADSSTVEEAMLSFLAANGFADAGVLVLPKSVLITLNSQDGFYTKMKHIDDVTPNFERLSKIYEYAKNPTFDIDELKTKIAELASPYTKLAFVGIPIGCAAFGLIIGCDIFAALAVFLSTFFAFWLKSRIVPFGVSPMFVNLACAYTATLFAFLFSMALGAKEVAFAQAASTFFLIPGVQLINAFEDMLKGHYLNGAARALRALFLSFGIVFGITLAIVTERMLPWSF